MRKLLFACFAALMVVAFAVPAMAADWNFYGNARMSTIYYSSDENASATAFSDQDLTWNLQGNSRIGARVKAGDVGGRFEYGAGPNLRILYGTWNFGAGQLLVGQGWTGLVRFLISDQVALSDNGLVGFGLPFESRKPMIRLSIGGFQFAAITPSTNTGNIGAAVDTDTTLPKLEANYSLKLGPAAITLMAGYNSIDLVDAADNQEALTSYFYGVVASGNFGPAYLKGTYWAGKNVNNYMVAMDTDGSADWDPVAGEVLDTDTFGYAAIIGFKVNDMLALQAGYGFQSAEDDISGHDKDEAKSYYLQANISLAKGVMLVPEIGVNDHVDSDTGVDQGKTSYVGAKWQINF